MMLSSIISSFIHTYMHVRTHTFCNQYTQWNVHCLQPQFLLLFKKRKYLYQKKVEVNNKLMLRSWERRRERVKSNEAAISRFSSQDSKPLKKREEKKNLKFNQFIRNANISHCKILTFFNDLINLYFWD